MYLLSLLPLVILLPSTISALAFPGAEGFGRNALGGRNGTVYVVSNLNDSGPGSLRDGVSQPHRIIVFSTGGIIHIKSRIVVSPRISILGQTAPGDGITVYGNGWSFSNADDAIVRYIRIRMGKSGSSGKDALGIASGWNMIFDHVSVSWGRDETFSISGDDVGNVTIQNSIIAQGLETHSCGGLVQTQLGNGVSLLRNLYADNKTRNPKVKGTNEFTNNVVYNWGEVFFLFFRCNLDLCLEERMLMRFMEQVVAADISLATLPLCQKLTSSETTSFLDPVPV